MNTVESLGYLKGLIDGLDVKNESEAKIYKAIIEVIENIVDDIDDIYEEIDSVEEQVDEIDEALADVEAYLDDDCDCDCDCDCEDDCCEYELECPACGEKIVVDECTIEEGGIDCPSCGEYLEFEVTCDCDEDADEE